MRVLRLCLCLSLLMCVSAFADAQTQIQGPRDNAQVYSGVVYGPIDQNDTLWRIASRYKQDSQFSVYQVMLAIYELNPQAFENGNFNTMVNGATLQLPSDRYIARTNPERAREKAVQDDRAFGRQNSVRDPVAGQGPDGQADQASNLKPDVPLVNQQDLSNTQSQLQRQLDVLKRQQREQIAVLREQVATSLENVEVLLQENRNLNERLLQIDDNNRVLTQTVETELQTQIDQQVAQLNQLIALMKENEQRRIDESSGSLLSFLKSNTGIMIISITVVLLVLILFGILILRRPAPVAIAEPISKSSASTKTPDIVDDELVIGEIDESTDSSDSDDLMAALADDDALQVDDILSDELEDEDALSNLSDDILDDDMLTADMLDDDLSENDEEASSDSLDNKFEVDLSSDFDDLDDDMLVPDIKKSGNETNVDEQDDEFGISLDEIAGDNLDDLTDADDIEIDQSVAEDLANEPDFTSDESSDHEGMEDERENSSDAIEQVTNQSEELEKESNENTQSVNSHSEKSQDEQAQDTDLPEGISLDENGDISNDTIEQIEKQIEKKNEDINRLADELLGELDESIAEENSIDLPAQTDTVNEDITDDLIADITSDLKGEEELDKELGLESEASSLLEEPPEGLSEDANADLADEILDDLSEDVNSDDELDSLLAEFEVEEESLDSLLDNEADSLSDNDSSADLLDDIPSFMSTDDESGERILDDETQTKTEQKEDADDVLSGLPDLDNWLDEDDSKNGQEAKPAALKASEEIETDLTSELDDANFDEMLEELSSETSAKQNEEDKLLSDLDLDGLDIDALMSDDIADEDALNDESVKDDFVDVDELLRESESLPEMSDDDIDLDIENSLDHLVDTGKDKIADLDETDIDQAGNLDLAQVYIDMEDHEAAKELLDEVIQKGTPEQQKEAADLLKDLDKS